MQAFTSWYLHDAAVYVPCPIAKGARKSNKARKNVAIPRVIRTPYQGSMMCVNNDNVYCTVGQSLYSALFRPSREKGAK